MNARITYSLILVGLLVGLLLGTGHAGGAILLAVMAVGGVRLLRTDGGDSPNSVPDELNCMQ